MRNLQKTAKYKVMRSLNETDTVSKTKLFETVSVLHHLTIAIQPNPRIEYQVFG